MLCQREKIASRTKLRTKKKKKKRHRHFRNVSVLFCHFSLLFSELKWMLWQRCRRQQQHIDTQKWANNRKKKLSDEKSGFLFALNERESCYHCRCVEITERCLPKEVKQQSFNLYLTFNFSQWEWAQRANQQQTKFHEWQWEFDSDVS